MVVAQKVKEAEITEQDSLLLTRNLLRIAIFNISYIRGLFPEKYFNDKSVPALEMKIKKLMPLDAESRRLIDWMEKGVYDALQRKYLKTLLFCVCEAVDGPMIEEYAFSFSYSGSETQEVSMNVNRIGNKKQGETFKCNSTTEITPQHMRSSACKMIRTLVQLMRTLDRMPEERTILMKLLYYDDVTTIKVVNVNATESEVKVSHFDNYLTLQPADYEPPFFRCCTEVEANHPWTKTPLKMEVGNVNSKHFVLALKVKSVLDPCEDENDGLQDEDMSCGNDSLIRDEHSDSDSEVDHCQGDRYIVAPIEKEQAKEENNAMVDEDNTQDSVEDEQQMARVKEWINCCHLDTIELTDVLSNFPDISVILTEEIMDKLVKEGLLSKIGSDSYAINKEKKSKYEFAMVKEESYSPVAPVSVKALQVDDRMYMKALYHALPMNYVSVTKLQSKLEGEVNQTGVRKIIDKMTRDGFVESKGSRKLGKRVIHSELTERKLIEVQKALSAEPMDVDHSQPRSKQVGFHLNGGNLGELSTCGALHSIGSDLTRMRVRSNTNETDSNQSGRTLPKPNEPGGTPTSRVEPVASRESFARANGNSTRSPCDEVDTVVGRVSSQDKRARKTSTVKEPILQYVKRQKCQLSEPEFRNPLFGNSKVNVVQGKV